MMSEPHQSLLQGPPRDSAGNLPQDPPQDDPPQEDSPPGGRPGTPGAALRTELLVARARAAARSGDLDGALDLLRSATATGGGRPDRTVLDLMARIHAQRGEFADADECWARVQEDAPGDADAAAGRAMIADVVAGRRRPQPVLRPARVGAVAAVAVWAVLTGTALWVTTDDPGPRPGVAQRDAGRDGDAGKREGGAGSPAAQAGEEAREEARRKAELDALARELTFPGANAERRGDFVRVVFDEGLFSEGDRLTPKGREALTRLGRRLAGREAAVEVTGHVAAVPGAPRSGGSALALWRAMVAVRELSDSSGRPLTAFTTSSADQRDAPHPDPSGNRTVTVTVTPADPGPEGDAPRER